jgi:hypothetical protein
MARTPDRTLEEFKTSCLEEHGPGNARSAIAFPHPRGNQRVRQGVHAYHLGRNHSMLSKMVVDHSKAEKGNVKCSVCGRSSKTNSDVT